MTPFANTIRSNALMGDARRRPPAVFVGRSSWLWDDNPASVNLDFVQGWAVNWSSAIAAGDCAERWRMQQNCC